MSLPHDHALLSAASTGQFDHLRELLAQEEELDQEKLSRIGMEAAQAGQTDVLDILLHHGWIINPTDSRHNSLLPDALRQNRTKLVTWLLDKNVDPNISGSTQSKTGTAQEITPLTIAAKNCSLSTIKELINHGASIEKSEALSAAATSHTEDRVDKLAFLIDKGADVNEMQLVLPEHTSKRHRSGMGTALHAACKWGFEDSEVFLLEHGADPTMKNSQDQSIEDLKQLPVCWAQKISSCYCCRKLIRFRPHSLAVAGQRRKYQQQLEDVLGRRGKGREKQRQRKETIELVYSSVNALMYCHRRIISNKFNTKDKEGLL